MSAQRDRSRREYARLASAYDTRWHGYGEDIAHRLRRQGLETATADMLDVGCGTGVMLQRFGGPGSVGVDPSLAMLSRARSRVARRVGGYAEALPFASASFRTVLSTSVLHYSDDVQRMLGECRRVLPPGGRLVLVDWCSDDPGTWLAATALRLLRRPLGTVLGAHAARACVSDAGFDVVEVARFRARPWWGMFVLDARAI